MAQYLLRRTAYSFLIILGVLMLTFVLFRLAAGDPATAMLGKNPTPSELEDMREALGSDKPMFFGSLKGTETFTNADFSNGRTNFSSVELSGVCTATDDGVRLSKNASLSFKRNFLRSKAGALTCKIVFSGENLSVNGKLLSPDEGETGIEFSPDSIPEALEIKNVSDNGVSIHQVKFYLPTKHFFDSQALASLKEVASFKSTFPYVTFFNFGRTLQTREDIRTKIIHGMVPSLAVMVPIFIGELVFGIILAMISCAFYGRMLDRLTVILSVAGMSISYLALIIFGQWYFAYYLNVFPVWGWGGVKYALLPIAIGIFSGTGSGVRFYRTVFLNEIKKEYLRTEKAKGASAFTIYFKHLLKNSLVPIITRASSVLPFLFTGSLLLESFFGIPGLGYEGINAINDSDLQMLKALVITGALMFVVINLLADVAYAWVDPRMRSISSGKRS